MEYTMFSSNLTGGYGSNDLFFNVSDNEEEKVQILISELGPKRKSLSVTILLMFVYCLIFMTGIIGNVFTCIVIIRTSYMRTSTNYYLFSLAVSDLILLLIGLPPEAYSIWESYPWRFGKAFCIIKALFAEMTSYASVLTITAFTIERYIAICKPLKSHKFVAFSRCIKIIIAIWIVSLCCALPYPIHTELFFYVKDKQNRPIEESLQCNIPPKYYERMTHVFQLSTFVFFVFPLTVIIVLYTLIGCTLRKAELSRESSDKRYQGSCRHGTSGHHDRSPTFIARRSVLKVLVAVVVAFFVCWAPFHAQRLLTVYNRHWTPTLFDLQSSLFYISGVLYFIGSTVNPILYNVMSRRYRLAFLETICNSRSPRTIGSQGLTNVGRKASSIKGSLNYSNIKTNNIAKLPKNYRYLKTAKSHTMFRSLDSVRKSNGSRNDSRVGRTVSFDEEKHVCGIQSRSLKELSHQELFQAEKKHAIQCMAENGHVCDHACALINKVDIPTRHVNTRCQTLRPSKIQAKGSLNSVDNCLYCSDRAEVGDFV